uniref:Uncharacterized protein n=1 Tax=Rhizophora mucronata TaxID=61149 RepID=A0A2P2Q7L4_RHIMU
MVRVKLMSYYKNCIHSLNKSCPCMDSICSHLYV